MTAARIKSYVRGRPRLKRLVLLWMRLFDPFFQSNVVAIPRYIQFLHDWQEYKKRSKPAVYPRMPDWYPRLGDKTATHTTEIHYFYQDIWAFKNILESGRTFHVDIGSRDIFVGMLSTITKVMFVDIRPLVVQLESLYCVKSSILELPFLENSLPSLSCLHVAEHIGLGRYGDPLDSQGTQKACHELARVLGSDGDLYFSVPIGRARVCFNAHRVHTADQILDYFADLRLIELSGIDDRGRFSRNRSSKELDDDDYACGLFWFRKP